MPMPDNWPQTLYEELTSLGRLYLEDFLRTKALWEEARRLGIDINPFEDTRLNSYKLKLLRDLLLAYKPVDQVAEEAVQRIKSMIFQEIPLGYGIISFSD
jgi:hypothetical protein